jgi:hypothetical protein
VFGYAFGSSANINARLLYYRTSRYGIAGEKRSAPLLRHRVDPGGASF